MIGRGWRFPFCALGVAVLTAAPVAFAQTSDKVELTPAQMIETAKLSVRAGELDQAIALADALLVRDPHDIDAHLVRGHALRAQHAYGPARSAARAAWRNGKTDLERYNAALLMAQALSSDEKRTRAQFWLRRAVEYAPSPGHARRATRDFKYVRQRNPWQTYLSFTLAPNSNINNGSSRDTYFADFPGFGTAEQPIAAQQRALSGLELGAQIQTRYRFHQTERQAHDLRLGVSYRSFILSDNSKSDVPDARGSDYAYGTASVGYGFRQLRDDRRGEFSATIDMGQTFYAGSRYAAFVVGSADQTYLLNKRSKLSFGARAKAENGQRVSDNETFSLSIGYDRALQNGNGLHLGFTVTEQTSANATLEYRQVRIRGGYVLGRKMMGANLRFGVGVKLRDYDTFLLSFDGRRDLEVSFDLTATFTDMAYYGFTPQVGISAAKTDSTIGVYDSNRVGINFGIVSAF